ncbi:MAG: helix-turn-helix domain-containing protein [Bacteroidota bacterium]
MRKTTSTNFENEQGFIDNCPITSTMKIIGGRWKVIIIYQLSSGAKRYSEMRNIIGAISEKMLTQQLKALVEDGWVAKTDYKEIPPRTEYELTQLGNSFVPILKQIEKWGNQYLLKG